MKKTAILFAATLGLLLLAPFLVELQTVEAGLNVISPANTTYSSNSLLLNVNIHRLFKPTEYDSKIMYSLNGENNVTFPSTETFFDMTTPDSIWSALMSYTSISGTAYLQNLSEGYHSLTVFGVYERAQGISTKYPAIMQDTKTVYFTINDGVPPSITNMGIENRTYNQNNLPLNFTVDEPTCWTGYSLDGKNNVTLTENMTLIGLEYGSHSLVVYANDTVGNMGASDNINFTVEKPESSHFVSIAAVSLVAVALAAAGLLFYHKRKTKTV